MKQVTGSNPKKTADKVSIQQSLDGHSFSVRGVGSVPEEAQRVEVEVLAERTMLVPKELFDGTGAPALLAAAGKCPAAGERVVWSDPEAETIALMAVGAEALREVEERLGGRIRFTTPLLHLPQATVPTVWLHYTGQLLYIKVYNGLLRLAEVVPARGEADLRYLAERLAGQFAPEEYELRLSGEQNRTVKKVFGSHFPQTVCE